MHNDSDWVPSKFRNPHRTVRTVSPVRPLAIVARRAGVVAVCLVLSVIVAPTAGSDPETEPASAATAPAEGSVPSSPPTVLNTPDGWTLGLGARDERQVPVAPLTTALSSREYITGGIFAGSLIGPEQPRGLLEAGYEIGCGIDMSTSNGVTPIVGGGITPSLGTTALLPGAATGLLPLISTPLTSGLEVGLKPGLVIVVPVDRKQFKGPNPWIMINNFHIKIDGCVGQSFIRSYAVLTRVTDQSDVVLSYSGVTKTY